MTQLLCFGQFVSANPQETFKCSVKSFFSEFLGSLLDDKVRDGCLPSGQMAEEHRPSSCGQLLCSFASPVTCYQRELDLPGLRHSNPAKRFLQGILSSSSQCAALQLTRPRDPRLADIHLPHSSPGSAEDNPP